MIVVRRSQVVILAVLVCFVTLAVGTLLSQRRFGPQTPTAPAVVATPTPTPKLVQSAVQCQGSTTTTTFTPQAFFGGATKGDLLVAVASVKDAAVINTPAGYTSVFNKQTATTSPSLALFYKIAVGGETSVTFSFSGATRPCGGLAEYSGTSMNAPLHGVSLGNVGTGTAPPLGTGTINVISPVDLGVAVFSDNSTNSSWSSSYTAPPAGDRYQDFFDAYGGTSGSLISMFYVDCAVGSCAGTTSTTITQGGDWRGFIASFYPLQTASNTSTGSNVTTTAGNGSVTFTNVTSGGSTSVTSIDPTSPSQGAAPSGITYNSSSPSYDISTTATFTGNVTVCIHIPDIPTASYPTLHLLHKEAGVLVDRTTGVNTAAKTICGSVSSLSPFIVASGPATTTAAGISISGRVMTSDGRGIRNATVLLNDQYGKIHTVRTSAFGYYVFDGITSGETYVVNVNSRGFTFLPRVVNLSDSLTDVNLVASP